MLTSLCALLLRLASASGPYASGIRMQAGNDQTQASAKPQAVPGMGGISSYQGLMVREIRITNVPAKEQERLLRLLPQKQGEALDRDRLRQSIQMLHNTGRFGDIRAEAETTTDGQVSLVFVTTNNYFVGQINVDGAPGRPSGNQVANAAKLQLGELFTQEKRDRALKNIKLLMEENGFYRSKITDEERKDEETQQVGIVFHVISGAQAQVGQVTVTGAPGYSQQEVQDIAKVHSADAVTVSRTTRALQRLRKKYEKQKKLLAQVTISQKSYRPEVNAVDYTFDIKPGPKVEVVAEGFKIKRGTLKALVPVYEENALDDDLLNEGRRNIINYLETRGYFDAKVEMKKTSNPAGTELLVTYSIDEGSRHKVAKVEITGAQYFLPELLRPRMQVQTAGRLLSHGRFNQALLNDDVAGLENLYRANGFQQVKITSSVEDNYQGQDNQIALLLHVEEGAQTLVHALHIAGNQAISEDQFPALNTSADQPYSETNISSDRDILLNYYYNHGFPDATLEASANPVAGAANRMDVTFTIHEGDQFFVDQVLVTGLHFTRPYVVQRELRVKSGNPLSQIAMLRTQQQLYDLGIFSEVDTAVQNPTGTEREKDVLVAIQEAKRYTFNYGVGLEFQTGQPTIGTNQAQGETGVSPRVSFGVTRLNFRGRNSTIAFKAHVGRLQQRGLLSYEAPRWFNSRDWKFSITTFYDNTLDVTTFTSQRLEGSIQATQILTRAASDQPVSTMFYRFTYRRVQASNLDISPNQIPLLSQPTRVGMPSFSYIRDKRDNALDTTRGNYTTLDAGVASGYFGSEANFSRVLIQNSTYQAFGKNRPAGKQFVFARSTRIGIETPFSNTVIVRPGEAPPAGQSVIPLPELFLSGGGNSHRGFGLNQAGPRDPNTGFPVGGGAMFINNLELRFPPPTLPYVQDNVSFAIFHDAGNVFTTGQDMLHNLLRWKQKNPQSCLQDTGDFTPPQCDYSYISHAIGVGVRYKTPIGPVRFDFGYNLNPPAFPSCQAQPSSGNVAVSAHCVASDPTAPVFVPQHARHFNISFSIGQTF